MSIWDWVLVIIAVFAVLVGGRGVIISVQAMLERSFGGAFLILAMALAVLAGGGVAAYQALWLPHVF